MPDSSEIVHLFSAFTGSDLTNTVRRIETDIKGLSAENCNTFLERNGASHEVFSAAMKIKDIVGQIDVMIHALGILLCLPHILKSGEQVQHISLGAGNGGGRKFDLETNYRVAEFKFSRWRGGSEAARQNSLFADYVKLEQYSTSKDKYLYVFDKGGHTTGFLESGRTLRSVLSRNNALMKMFFDRFGDQFQTVRDYYAEYKNVIQIKDVSQWLLNS